MKINNILIGSFVALTLSGCYMAPVGVQSKTEVSEPVEVEEPVEEEEPIEEVVEEEKPVEEEVVDVEEPVEETGDIIDIAAMTGKPAIDKIDDMFANFDDYKGKTIQIRGVNNRFENFDTGDVYHTIMVAGASCCGTRSIEYIMADGVYPVMNAIVKIRGTFDCYEEGNNIYYVIKDATLVEDE